MEAVVFKFLWDVEENLDHREIIELAIGVKFSSDLGSAEVHMPKFKGQNL